MYEVFNLKNKNNWIDFLLFANSNYNCMTSKESVLMLMESFFN